MSSSRDLMQEKLRQIVPLLPENIEEKSNVEDGQFFVASTQKPDQKFLKAEQVRQNNQLLKEIFQESLKSPEAASVWLSAEFKAHVPEVFNHQISEKDLENFIGSFPNIMDALINDNEVNPKLGGSNVNRIRKLIRQQEKLSSTFSTVEERVTKMKPDVGWFRCVGSRLSDEEKRPTVKARPNTTLSYPHRVALIFDLVRPKDSEDPHANAKQAVKHAVEALNHTRSKWLPKIFRPQAISTRQFYVKTISDLVSAEASDDRFLEKIKEKIDGHQFTLTFPQGKLLQLKQGTISNIIQRHKELKSHEVKNGEQVRVPHRIKEIYAVLLQPIRSDIKKVDIAMLAAEALSHPGLNQQPETRKLYEEILDILLEPQKHPKPKNR